MFEICVSDDCAFKHSPMSFHKTYKYISSALIFRGVPYRRRVVSALRIHVSKQCYIGLSEIGSYFLTLRGEMNVKVC